MNQFDWREAARTAKHNLPEFDKYFPVEQRVPWARRTTKQIRDMELFKEYVRHMRSKNNKNTQPWHALGERMVVAGHMLMCGLGACEIKFANTGRNLDRPIETGLLVLNAMPYLWSQEMLALARSCPLPRHTISFDAAPFPAMFFSMETAYPLQDSTGKDIGEMNWILVFVSEENRIEFLHDISTPGETPNVAGSWVKEGQVFPDDFGDPFIRQSIEQSLSLLAFLNSPYTTAEPTQIERALRRRIARAGDPVAPAVSVVKLRQRRGESHESESTPVEWKHRWWVRGHYRAQWIPSKHTHRVIWIAPYLKGPDDMPVVQRIYDVCQ